MQSVASSSPSVAVTALCDPWSAWRRARLLQLQSLSVDELRSLLLREEERRLRLQSPVPPVDPAQDDVAAAASLAAFVDAFAPAFAPAAASTAVAHAPACARLTPAVASDAPTIAFSAAPFASTDAPASAFASTCASFAPAAISTSSAPATAAAATSAPLAFQFAPPASSFTPTVTSLSPAFASATPSSAAAAPAFVAAAISPHSPQTCRTYVRVKRGVHAKDAQPYRTTDAPHESTTGATQRADTAADTHTQADVHAHHTQSSAHVSPAMRLYRHALESIFAMLNLQDLLQILPVSRSWSAAVTSMKPIGATIEREEAQLEREGKRFRPLPPIWSLVTGPLLRHLTGIQIIANDQDRFAFTPVTAPGALEPHACIDFSLLGSAPSLQDLSFDDLIQGYPTLSDRHITQIRSALGHLRRIAFRQLDHPVIARLLQPPVTARWQDIGMVYAYADTGDLLARLPTLTKLDLDYLHMRGKTPHADFLTKLPLLSSLKLYCSNHIPPAPLLASLSPCIGLTELDLRCEFNSAQVGALLSSLTKLRTLKLVCRLDTLQCFSSGLATRTLESFSLEHRVHPFPPSELVHLYALHGLRDLVLERVFGPLDDAALASLTPPTASFPRLVRSVHTRASDWNEMQRQPPNWTPEPRAVTGPSFEWMQQRRTE